MKDQLSLSRSRQQWDEMAHLDPCWAILSDPKKKFDRWEFEEFYNTGEREVSELMHTLACLGYPKNNFLALDFGCGLGRLTRALAERFEKCVGVDISDEMIRRAKALNSSDLRCEFELNREDSLARYSSGVFDLIYTSMVLQHLPSKRLIKKYVSEFLRTLKPEGILVMQIPSAIPLRRRVQWRRRLYGLLRSLRCSEALLYRRLGLTPIGMKCIPEQELVNFVTEIGGRVLRTDLNLMAGPGIESRQYFITKDLQERQGASES